VFQGTALALTTVSGNGTTATLTFASQATAPFVVGSTIYVANVTNVGFNGAYTVTACTTTTVSYANSTNASSTGGTVQGNSQFVEVMLCWYNAGAVSSFSVTASNLKFNNGSAPTWTLTSGKRDFVKFFSFDGGTTWYESWRSLNM
jgi:hypothetical protein